MHTFSIVVPVYYNEPNLPDTVPQLLALEESLHGYKLELIFVDDGSGDRSLEILLDFRAQFPDKIKVVKLTRNFGAMAAGQAGLSAATGDCVGIIAADLQDPPELFCRMIDYWEKGIKAVYAVRTDREEPFTQKLISNTYYALLERFAIKGFPKGGFDFLLIDRQLVNDILKMNEKNTHLSSLVFWLGYENVMIPYVRRKRTKGTSRWTLSKKIKLLIDSFVSFSYVPIRALSTIGLLVAGVSFVYGGMVCLGWLFFEVDVKGWTSLMIVLAFAVGIQMMTLGVLGEYLWRTLDETRKRPSFVIDEIFDEKNRD